MNAIARIRDDIAKVSAFSSEEQKRLADLGITLPTPPNLAGLNADLAVLEKALKMIEQDQMSSAPSGRDCVVTILPITKVGVAPNAPPVKTEVPSDPPVKSEAPYDAFIKMISEKKRMTGFAIRRFSADRSLTPAQVGGIIAAALRHGVIRRGRSDRSYLFNELSTHPKPVNGALRVKRGKTALAQAAVESVYSEPRTLREAYTVLVQQWGLPNDPSTMRLLQGATMGFLKWGRMKKLGGDAEGRSRFHWIV